MTRKTMVPGHGANVSVLHMNIALWIVADRGGLKAYQCGENKEPNNERSPALIGYYPTSQWRGRLQDKVTDKAGAFSAQVTAGHGNSTAERMEAELQTRSFREIADRIHRILSENHPLRWGFAAPPEINAAILEGLSPADKEHLVRNLQLDLINVPGNKLPEHFKRQSLT